MRIVRFLCGWAMGLLLVLGVLISEPTQPIQAAPALAVPPSWLTPTLNSTATLPLEPIPPLVSGLTPPTTTLPIAPVAPPAPLEGEVGSYGAQSLPALQGFQPDGFSGNSTLALPVSLPPTPGNVPFGLSFSYSTEGINGLRAGTVGGDSAAAFKQQADIVGWGWDVAGLGTISREFRSDLNGDTNRVFLSFGGGSYQLLPTAAGWQTKPQSFIKIAPQGNHLNEYKQWYVWTPDGTRYTFGSPDWNHPSVAYQVYPGNCENQFRQAHLTEILDIHGNRVTIEYAREEGSVTNCAQSYVRAVRPLLVQYFPAETTTSTARVRFGYQGRPDVDIHRNTVDSQVLYSSHRLVGVAAEVRTGNGAEDFALFSRYRLTHDFDDWNGTVTSEGAPRSIMRLRALTAVGREGGTLPAWAFDYTRLLSVSPNFNALHTYHNGQGGTVQYSYENVTGIQVRHCGVPGDKLTSRFRVSQMVVGDGLGNAVTHRYAILRPGQSDVNPSAWAQGWGEALNCLQNFEFGGYNYVRHETVNAANVVQQADVTEYHQAALHSDGKWYLEYRKGRPWRQQILGTDQSVLSEQQTTWGILNSASTGYMGWVYKGEQTSTTDGVSQRALYGYDSYGNTTRVWEFLPGQQTPYRTQESYYLHRNTGGTNPQAVVYLVNRPYRQRTWAGDIAWPNLATCQQDAAYLYDGQPYGVVPTRGDLTLAQVAATSCETSWVATLAAYDRWGNVTQRTDALGRVTTTTYDTSDTPPTGWWPLYALPTRTTNALGQTIDFTWNAALGQVTRVSAATGQTGYSYDEFGRLHKVWQPEDTETNPTQLVSYQNYAGPTSPFLTVLAQRSNPSNELYGTYLYTRTFSDGLGREVQRRVPYADTPTTVRDAVNFTTYNAVGGVERAYAPISVATGTSFVNTGWNPTTHPSTRYEYDRLGRLFRETLPNGTWTDHRYGGLWDSTLNQWVSYYNVVDGNHHRRQTRTDALGRMVAVIEFAGNCGTGWTGHLCDSNNPTHVHWSESARTHYQYDALGRVVGTTDALGNQTTMGYDLLGRKLTMSDPTMGTWRYRYDAVGNLRVQRDARGQTLCFAYDALNRLVGKHQHGVVADIDQTTCPDLTAFGYRYQYDENGALGQRTSMKDPSGGTMWRYDARGRLLEETKTIVGAGTFRSQWSYDGLDRVRTMRYPADNLGNLGETVTYSYASQAAQLIAVGTGYASNLSYNQHGQLLGMTLGNGVVQQINYWPLSDPQGGGRMAHLRAGKVAPLYQELAHLRYRYDAVGNVSERLNYADQHPTTGFQTESFSYDERNRLLEAKVRGGQQGLYPDTLHDYDVVGNLEQKGNQSYGYGVMVAGCDMQSTTKPLALGTIAGTTFQYDCAGNLVQRVLAKGGWQSYSYDGENRLTAVSVSTGPIANFLYDGDGQRVGATQQGATTFYVGQHVEWSQGTLTRYLYANGQRIAMRRGATLSFLLADALGSTTLTLSASGAPVAELRYDPWGMLRYESNPAPTAFRFTGQRLDAGTGLYFYQSRYYDPALGRFLQPDTIVPNPGDPQSFNRFAYVLNNPLRYTDPTGHFTEEAIAGYYGVESVEDIWWWNDPEYADWQAMLLTAEAGDILIYSCGTEACYYRFDGQGNTKWTSITSTDGNGVPWVGGWHGTAYRKVSLDEIMAESHLGGWTPQWFGFIRWTAIAGLDDYRVPSFYVRQGYGKADYAFHSGARFGVNVASSIATGAAAFLTVHYVALAVGATAFISGTVGGELAVYGMEAIVGVIGGAAYTNAAHIGENDYWVVLAAYPEYGMPRPPTVGVLSSTVNIKIRRQSNGGYTIIP